MPTWFDGLPSPGSAAGLMQNMERNEIVSDLADVAINVENLGKMYRIGAMQRDDTLRDLLARAFSSPLRRAPAQGSLPGSARGGGRSRNEHIWALRDVSFTVKRGETVGIIGRNGAGKSTLLKILSRVTQPTEGQVEIRGRVGSLLEVGTGFHPELTGRENIYLNGAILGMRKSEIDRKFDEIVAFAEIEKFLGTPVKRYSSGMYVRLAFAVAAHLEPEVLIVDEVLAVGDAAFQKKCLGKMGEVAREQRTVLFVSHNMGAVLQLCSRAIVLGEGRCLLDADAATAVSAYLGQMRSTSGSFADDSDPQKDVQITGMSVTSLDGDLIGMHPHSDPFRVLVNHRVAKWTTGAYVCLDVFNESDLCLIWSCDVKSVDEMLVERAPGIYESRITIPGMVLSPGRYYFTSAIYAPGQRRAASDAREKAISIEITDGGSFVSNFGLRPHSATMIPLAWETKSIA